MQWISNHFFCFPSGAAAAENLSHVEIHKNNSVQRVFFEEGDGDDQGRHLVNASLLAAIRNSTEDLLKATSLEGMNVTFPTAAEDLNDTSGVITNPTAGNFSIWALPFSVQTASYFSGGAYGNETLGRLSTNDTTSSGPSSKLPTSAPCNCSSRDQSEFFDGFEVQKA